VTLGGITWAAFAVWMGVGVAVYALYGRRHSVVARG